MKKRMTKERLDRMEGCLGLEFPTEEVQALISELRSSWENEKELQEGYLRIHDSNVTLQSKFDIAVKALIDIRGEQVVRGSGIVKEYENNLTMSLRNIAIEALDLLGKE